MVSYVRSPLVYTWLFLLAATLVGWWLGLENDAGARASGVSLAIVVLFIAIIKCRLVIRNYMEVRYAPRWLRLLCDAWLVANFAMISSFYWVAPERHSERPGANTAPFEERVRSYWGATSELTLESIQLPIAEL